ncbi:hypothetical protein BH09ACT1_BH09ACT1_07420 [soil metagenome]
MRIGARGGEVPATGVAVALLLSVAGLSAAPVGLTEYVVHLTEAPAVSYGGEIDGYPATRVADGGRFDAGSPAVRHYSSLLERRQDEIAEALGFTIDEHYSLTFAGFAAEVSAGQAAALAARPEVDVLEPNSDSTVQDDPIEHRSIATGLGDGEGMGGAWEELGGVENAGKGVVIGIIDSGITLDPTFFQGDPLHEGPIIRGGALRPEEPYWNTDNLADGTVVERTHVPKVGGGEFIGRCQTGGAFTRQHCTSKIVGARFYPPPAGAELDPAEVQSPIAINAHGPNVASIAAGDHLDDNPAFLGTTPSGIAPAASLAIYKACWKMIGLRQARCPSAGLLAAIEDAVADHVDVLNVSIGSKDLVNPLTSATSKALLGAVIAGVFVAASAGNRGPDAASIVDNTGPWLTTVANQTSPDFRTRLRLVVNRVGQKSKKLTFDGISMTPISTGETPFVVSSSARAPTATEDDADRCARNSLSTAVAGATVLCHLPVTQSRPVGRDIRRAMVEEVARAGGVAAVLATDIASSSPIDTPASIPSMLVPRRFGALSETQSASSATARFLGEPGVSSVIAERSSRGPITPATANILKPDVAAVGTGQEGATAGTKGVGVEDGNENGDENEDEDEGEDEPIGSLSGTSQATAVVSGLAALYLRRHPGASPAEIKSALMTTAHSVSETATTESGDVFAQGAGAVSGSRFLHPGLFYPSGERDWMSLFAYENVDFRGITAVPRAPGDLNLPSIQIGAVRGSQTITRVVTSTEAGNWTPTISPIEGFATSIEPQSLAFPAAGISRQFALTVTRTDAKEKVFGTGYLTWTNVDTATTARIPVAFRAEDGVERTAAEVAGTGSSGSTVISVSSTLSQPVVAQVTALIPGEELATPVGIRGPGNPGELVYDYPRFRADDRAFARFAVVGGSPSPDESLSVLLMRTDAAGTREVAAGEPEGISKILDARDLFPGVYFLRIIAPDTIAPPAWSVTSYRWPIGALRTLSVTPRSLRVGKEGAPFTLVWRRLPPGNTYVGLVNFGDPDWRSALTITVAGGSPTISAIANIPWSASTSGSGSSSASGSTLGGAEVTISGTGFTEGSTVTFDGLEAEVVERSENSLRVRTPANGEGPADVRVATGELSATEVDGFTYAAPPTITAVEPQMVRTDGDSVTVIGSGFTAGLELSIDGQLVIGRTVNSETEILASVPPGTVGPAKMTVTTPYGSAESYSLLRYDDRASSEGAR